MNLQLSNSDFNSIACPLGDEDKRRRHFGGIIANGIDRFYCKVCMDVTWADVNDPDKFCAHQGKSAKITVVGQNYSPRFGCLL